jgi:hypothetical protein
VLEVRPAGVVAEAERIDEPHRELVRHVRDDLPLEKAEVDRPTPALRAVAVELLDVACDQHRIARGEVASRSLL